MSSFNLKKTFQRFFNLGRLDKVSLLDFEEQLILADVGVELTAMLVDKLKNSKDAENAKMILKSELVGMLEKQGTSGPSQTLPYRGGQGGAGLPRVLLLLGVNGSGKTTTIAKLAKRYVDQKKKVLLVAADTFRAAAVDQLVIWGKRLGLNVLSKVGADSSGLVYSAVQKAKTEGYDIVLIDTAGRLHNNLNLMEELKKMSRVVGKAMGGAFHEKILVLDATVGSNGFVQAREFHKALFLTSAIIAKMDGTAKGGIVFSVVGELGLPVSYIGVGEGIEDLKPFDAAEFVNELF